MRARRPIQQIVASLMGGTSQAVLTNACDVGSWPSAKSSRAPSMSA